MSQSQARRGSAAAAITHWWATHAISGIDHRAVVAKVREDGGWSAHFAVMTLLSAGIAVLGLLLSSPAVVIGAMLISPLMDPIIALGFAVATFDASEMRRSGGALAVGVVLAVTFCAAIVLVSPLQTVTAEIASRTRPNLFDLLVALFSGFAGTYAMIRGRHGAIVGVAIATALMPPLAVMGFGIATADATVLGGSSLLFFTNLMTIAVAAAVLARLYGFAPGLSPHQTRLQASLIILVLIALAIPLAVSLRQIAWEALASREARETIAEAFPPEARISLLDIDFHFRPIEITGTVITPKYRQRAEPDLQQKLATVMRGPVILSLDQIRTANGSDSLSGSSASTSSASDRIISRLTERLSLVAGVPSDNILVDPAAKRALVRATALPGADVGVYRVLEARVAGSTPGWTIILVPPPAPIADVPVKGGAIDDTALQPAIWAAQRLHLPIGVSARRQKDAAAAVDLFTKSGVQAKIVPGSTAAGMVSMKWLAPEPKPATADAGPSTEAD